MVGMLFSGGVIGFCTVHLLWQWWAGALRYRAGEAVGRDQDDALPGSGATGRIAGLPDSGCYRPVHSSVR